MYVQTSEGLGQPVPPACKPEPGEVAASRTEAGILTKDVEITNKGVLVTDFGIDRRSVKGGAKSELASLIRRLETDPTIAEIRILGFSDCIGPGGARYHEWLRRERARRVHDLLGPAARTKVKFVGPAPLGTFIGPNTDRLGRARNRSVLIEFQRELKFEPEDVRQLACDDRIRTVTVWLNAFIPKDVPGLTRKVPYMLDASMAGKTMFDTAFGCGLTDQRSFSADKNAPSRMHSEAKIDLDTRRITDEKHHIHPSIQVDCMTGNITCNKTASTSPMTFAFVGVSSANEIMVRVKGSQGPACPAGVTGAGLKKVGQFLLDGKIDYEGTFFIKRLARNYVEIGFLGNVDLFPAYEFVVMLNDSNPIHLGGRLPATGSSPVTHLGTKQKIHFVRKLWLKCSNGKQVAGLYERTIN